MHFPKTNKVRIDNLNPEQEYPEAFVESIRKEYSNANKAATTTGLVPSVQNYRERGNMISYTQDYAGKPLPKRFKGISPKEQYKLGSQVGRMQNRLLSQGLGHTDIHEGNIVRPKPNGKEVKLIDNDAIKNMNTQYDEAEMKNLYWKKSLGKPFMTGYNSRINFTQHKQMQHFANFALNSLAGLGGMSGASIGGNIGGIIGAIKGAGVGESEEEKANTTGWGRAGKVLGKSLGGSVIGSVAGGTVGAGAGYGYGQLRRNNKGFDKWAANKGMLSEKDATSALTKARAEHYRQTGKPAPFQKKPNVDVSNNSYGVGSVSNFGFEQILNQAKTYGKQGLNNVKASGMAVGDVVKELGNEIYRPTQVAAAAGGLAGLVKGAGVGESEEEKANTTALGRAGKLFGNTAAGTAIGGTLGLGGQGLAQSTKYAYSRRRPEYDVPV
jgi:hypothetical protein